MNFLIGENTFLHCSRKRYMYDYVSVYIYARMYNKQQSLFTILRSIDQRKYEQKVFQTKRRFCMPSIVIMFMKTPSFMYVLIL